MARPAQQLALFRERPTLYSASRDAGLLGRSVEAPTRIRDLRAAGAECYFADRYGLPRPVVGGPDPGYDFRIPDRAGEYPDLLLDVKWSRYLDAHLVTLPRAARCHVFVLIIGYPYAIAGYAWANALKPLDLGHGPSYGLPRAELERDVDELLNAFGWAANGAPPFVKPERG